MTHRTHMRVLCAATLFGFAAATAAHAGAVRTPAGFDANIFASNDDGSVFVSDIGFSLNFFGVSQSSLWINNNGNVTFGGARGTFTPFDLTSTGETIIAPFFADVDTRGGNSVTYGTGSIDGRDAFFVNWIDVGHYRTEQDRLNSFQLVLIDRADTGAGNFDFEFNYDRILWETGAASGGDDDGLGGNSARVGFSNGQAGVDEVSLELQGSAINGAFLDGGINALISDSLNSDVDGRYLFTVRNGSVVNPVIPLPHASGLAMVGLGVIAARRRRG